MNEDAIKEIQRTAVKAASVTVLHLPGDPAHRSHLYDHQKGELAAVCAAPPVRRYQLFTLDDLVEGLKHFLANGYTDALVLCGRRAVTAILNEAEEGREELSLLLPFSGPFDVLRDLEEQRKQLGHGAFIDLLRIELAPGVNEAALLAVRNLRIRSLKDQKALVEQGKESLSGEVVREASIGGKPAPELLEVSVYVYRDLVLPAVLQQVTCSLKVNLEEGTLALIPLAGQVERAQQQTDASIARHLANAFAELPGGQVTVLCGGRGTSNPSD